MVKTPAIAATARIDGACLGTNDKSIQTSDMHFRRVPLSLPLINPHADALEKRCSPMVPVLAAGRQKAGPPV